MKTRLGRWWRAVAIPRGRRRRLRQLHETEDVLQASVARQLPVIDSDEDDEADRFEAPILLLTQHKPALSESSLDSTDTDLSTADSAPHKRSIQWVDEASSGMPLATTRVLEYETPLYLRAVILLLEPTLRKFEFLHVEYSTDECYRVEDVLEQLPALVSNPQLGGAGRHYTALYRDGQEMMARLDLNHYAIGEREILVAVAEGHEAVAVVETSAEILTSASILRALRLAKVSGRALRPLQSSDQWQSRTLESTAIDMKEEDACEPESGGMNEPTVQPKARSCRGVCACPVENDRRCKLDTMMKRIKIATEAFRQGQLAIEDTTEKALDATETMEISFEREEESRDHDLFQSCW